MPTTLRDRHHRRPRGFSLVEACVALAVTTTALGLALPTFEKARERRHLEGVAAQFETDVHMARSLAAARNQTLRIAFAGPSCYVVHTGGSASCSCTGAAASCTGDPEILRVVQIGNATPVALRSNSASIAIDALRGTVTPTATVQVQGRSGAAVHKVINLMGRVRSCSPAPALPGYPAC